MSFQRLDAIRGGELAPNFKISSSTATVRVTDVMHEIREVIFPTFARRADYVRTLEHSSVLLPELSRLEGLVESVRLGATHAGSMPASPHTLRGRIGAILIAVVRRALFWLTPQLHAYNLKVAAALNEQVGATQALVEDLRDLHSQIAEIKRRTAQIADKLALEESIDSAAERKEFNGGNRF